MLEAASRGRRLWVWDARMLQNVVFLAMHSGFWHEHKCLWSDWKMP